MLAITLFVLARLIGKLIVNAHIRFLSECTAEQTIHILQRFPFAFSFFGTLQHRPFQSNSAIQITEKFFY